MLGRRHLTLFVGSILVGTLMSASAQARESQDNEAWVQVQAQTTLDVTPDRATVNARLWERTPPIAMQDESTPPDPAALREARETLEERTGVLIRLLEQEGIASEAITAGSLSIRPDHIPGRREENGEPGMLVRTQLERPITLAIDDLTHLPMILDALTSSGVNALDGIVYELSDREAATDRALVQALEKARRKAELMAETLDVSLGAIKRVQETQSPIFAPRMMSMRADAMEQQAAPEYRPGTISIDAGVEVRWEIRR
ncbi:SIMPL domain-containing protein [Litchfieldella xinjiangensis]|uniref:SIMPL domain-containing protein n=1 Tax=Litchfieldella xinjiangensis TaxID=1166948 RepID=UPI0005B99F3C|nr:SIMPL domain-containing protein [Halomonas xinjiangensis]